MDLIAERRLDLRTDARTSVVIVRLYKPELDGLHDAWKCRYEILVGDTSLNMAMHGADSMQALQLSLATIDVELGRIARNAGGVLWHLEEPFNSILENGGLLRKPASEASQ